MKDFFSRKATDYDKNKSRVANVENIAKAIVENVSLKAHFHIMDFGSGTGLLLERIAPYVSRITAVDVSPSMNQQLLSKKEQLACHLDVLEIDLTVVGIQQTFDGIISSMTLHHVKHIESIFQTFYQLLNPGGFIAIADLDKEEGDFHTEDTGVHHFGFDHDQIASAAKSVGFSEVKITPASVVEKPQGNYPVFLLTAIKQ